MNKLSAFGLQFVAWPCDACVKQPERSRCGGAPSGGRRSRGRIDHLLHGAFRRVQVTGERHDQSTLLTRLLSCQRGTFLACNENACFGST